MFLLRAAAFERKGKTLTPALSHRERKSGNLLQIASNDVAGILTKRREVALQAVACGTGAFHSLLSNERPK